MAEPRDKLAQALEDFLTPEQLSKLVDDVLAMEKRVRVEMTCKKCGAQQIQFGSTSDVKAVALALPDLLNQAYGRPSEQEHTEQVVFTRWTKLEEPEAA